MNQDKITWDMYYQLPEPGNMMTTASNGREIYIKQGNRMSEVIIRHIIEYFGEIHPNLKILDFGCGNGRVALPFFYKYKKPTHCVDVDESSIQFIKTAIPQIEAFNTPYEPPLPFDDGTFDCVYAISVWTHLPDNLQLIWLKEIKRVLKSGGLALISTAGYRALKSRRQKNIPGWDKITDEDLRKRGFIFIESNPTRGVTGTYGCAAHDPNSVKDAWGEIFKFKETRLEEVEGVQDLNVLVKP